MKARRRAQFLVQTLAAFAIECILLLGLGAYAEEVGSEGGTLLLPEEPIPLAVIPDPPRRLLELGNGFLEPTQISSGWKLPTGAVWQPAFLLWGTARSALQTDLGRGRDVAEWASRFDLFGELSLTETERFVVGIEPFQDGTEFTGYRLGLEGEGSEFVSSFNFTPDIAFFEGDVGELFPALDFDEIWPLDLGFMVGRVPVNFQDGFLIDDRMAAIGLVQNSIASPGASNLRISMIAAWDGVHRGDNSSGGDSLLFGLFTEFDRPHTTWAIDAVYVKGDQQSDGVFAGVSAIRRLGARWNWTTRVLGSLSLDEPVESGIVEDGLLGVLGLSYTPRGTHNVAYLNLVAGAGHYTASARAADLGGPLGRVGILFEAFGLGSIGSPLANDAEQVYGGALGTQLFFDHGRTQLVFEVAGRNRFDDSRSRAAAAGMRFQRALGQRTILRFDAYGGIGKEEGVFGGGRTEIVVKF